MGIENADRKAKTIMFKEFYKDCLGDKDDEGIDTAAMDIPRLICFY